MRSRSRPTPPLRRCGVAWPLAAVLAGAAGLGGAESKKEPPPLIEVRGAGLQVPIEMKSSARIVTDEEFERALTNKTAEAAKDRMAAVLAGEQATQAALQRSGQARIDALEQAARGGEAAAAELLGDMLDTGDGLKADPARATGYYRAAALGGRMAAAHSLAVAYAKGRGVRQDFTEALGWMIVARRRGDESGVEQQLRDYLHRHGADAAIAAAEKRAAELAAKPAAGSIAAALPVAAPLEFDEGLATPAQEEDDHAAPGGEAAETRPERAPDAAPETPPLVVMTILGERLTWPTLAALQNAANRGEPAALTALGRLLTNGKLLPPDPMRAVLLLEQAAAKGEIDAAHQLGDLYSKSEGIVRDDAKAFTYSLQAARGGSTLAMANVGVFYTNGRGVTRDLVRGLAWLALAKEYGVDLGQEGRLRAFLTQYRPADVKAAAELAGLLRQEVKGKSR